MRRCLVLRPRVAHSLSCEGCLLVLRTPTLLAGLLLCPTGCGRAEGDLCESAEECDSEVARRMCARLGECVVIEESQLDHCDTDLQSALRDDLIRRDDVELCLASMKHNSCIVSGRGSQACGDIWGYALGWHER